MPTLDQCITAKGDAGLVDRGRARNAAKEYRQAVEDLAADGEVSIAEAERLIGQRFLNDQDRAAAIRKSNAIRTAAIQKEILESVKAHEELGVPVDVVTQGRITFDPSSRYKGASLENRINTVRNQAHLRYADALKKFRTKYAGLTGRAEASDEVRTVVREVFGENTGNKEAKELAKALQDTMEYLRLRFNAAGGDIAKRQNYGLHQSHDQAAVLSAPKDEWVDFTMKLMDRDKMLDSAGRRMSDKQLRRALEEAHKSIATGGASDLSTVRPPSGAGSSVNRRANHRFLVFKDGNAWMKYHDQFGVGDIQDHILSTMSRFARDIGELEILGPNSQATLRFMQQIEDDAFTRGAMSADGKKARSLAAKVGRNLNDLNSLYDIVTGRAAVPAREGMARFGQSIRNVLMASQLASAFLVAISDVATASMTAKMNGMSSLSTVRQIFRTFATDQTNQRELALRAGFGAQGWASHAIGSQRFTGELAQGHAVTEKVADTVLRASLLTPFTEAGRYGFQLELSGFITDNLKRSYDKLPNMLRKSMQRYGISEADWKVMQETAVWQDPVSGTKLLRAHDIYDGDFAGPKFDAANKLQQMILTETQFAVVSSTSRVRQFLGEGKFKKGTLWGEIIANVGMYKSFPVSILHTHLQRAFYQGNPNGSLVRGAAYLAPLMAGMTVMGAMGMQANEVASGRDPRKINGAFLQEAMVKGGSLGLLGDFLLTQSNGYKSSIVDLLVGPGVRNLSDIKELTVDNVIEGASGEDTNFGKEMFRFVKGLMPGQNLWYAKLIQERAFYDHVESLADPEAHKSWRRTEQRARTENDQKYFWRPGRTKPTRLPSIGG